MGLFSSVGIFGVFLFLTYYLQATLKFSPVKTGVAFLPLVAALATMAQVSNRVLLPRLRSEADRTDRNARVCCGYVRAPFVGVDSAYVSHVLPYLLVLGIGSGLSVSPRLAPAP